jgi:hypothetical protein
VQLPAGGFERNRLCLLKKSLCCPSCFFEERLYIYSCNSLERNAWGSSPSPTFAKRCACFRVCIGGFSTAQVTTEIGPVLRRSAAGAGILANDGSGGESNKWRPRIE